jgi:hypothetical protein
MLQLGAISHPRPAWSRKRPPVRFGVARHGLESVPCGLTLDEGLKRPSAAVAAGVMQPVVASVFYSVPASAALGLRMMHL